MDSTHPDTQGAAEQSLPAFGTLALLHVLIEDDLIQDTLRADVTALSRAHVVDLMLTTDELLDIAEGEHWMPGAAATYVRRGLFWADGHSALSDFLLILAQSASHAPEHVRAWVVAACVGISDHLGDDTLETDLADFADVLVERLAADTSVGEAIRQAAQWTAEELRRQRIEDDAATTDHRMDDAAKQQRPQ